MTARSVSLRSALFADVYRKTGRGDWMSVARVWLTSRTFRPILTMRLCQSAANMPRSLGRIILPLSRSLHRLAQWQAGMDLPWEIQVGPGFAINHGWGLVISPGAVIGANVTLFQGVTLGRKDVIDPVDGTRTTSYPVIEDSVSIGPNAVVLGGVCLGQGCQVGASCVVTKNVPPRAVVVGNPMRVIRTDALPDVMNAVDGELRF